MAATAWLVQGHWRLILPGDHGGHYLRSRLRDLGLPRAIREAVQSGVALPIGMFAFAWTNYPSIHCSVSIILSAPFEFGCMLVIPLMTYLIDSYTIYAASVLAAAAIFRSIIGAVFSFFTTQVNSILRTPLRPASPPHAAEATSTGRCLAGDQQHIHEHFRDCNFNHTNGVGLRWACTDSCSERPICSLVLVLV
jgi:hypothetical protein